jgi:hypothetical protein
MAGLNLPFRLPDFGQQLFLIRYIRLNRIGDKKIRAAPGNFGQSG